MPTELVLAFAARFVDRKFQTKKQVDYMAVADPKFASRVISIRDD